MWVLKERQIELIEDKDYTLHHIVDLPKRYLGYEYVFTCILVRQEDVVIVDNSCKELKLHVKLREL